MKTKKLISSAVLLGLGVSLVAPTSLAVESSLAGKGTIKYEKDTSVVKPVDPENPGEKNPENPGNVEVNTKEGEITIDVVSNLDFKTQKTTTSQGEYYAVAQEIIPSGKTEKEKRGNYVQVTDKRSADARKGGWELKAQMTKQFTNGAGDTLKGATLTYENAFVNTTKAPIDLAAPGAKTLTVGNDGKGTTETFLSASTKTDKTQGWGTYSLEFGRPVVTTGATPNTTDTTDSSVKLVVPANTPISTADAYVAEITWTIAELD